MWDTPRLPLSQSLRPGTREGEKEEGTPEGRTLTTPTITVGTEVIGSELQLQTFYSFSSLLGHQKFDTRNLGGNPRRDGTSFHRSGGVSAREEE